MIKAGTMVRLLTNGQFGDLGPRAGAEGEVISTSEKKTDAGYEKWHFVYFAGSPGTYHNIHEDMIEEV